MTSINVSSPLSITRRPAFLILVPLALLALLAASLLLLLPGGTVQAQAAAISLDYDENGTGPVFTFASRDPEGVVPPTIWSVVTVTTGIPDIEDVDDVDIVDNNDFSINDDGVLTFNTPPNYEVPTDNVPANNVYNVTVQASDGGVTEHRSWYKVDVTVRDVEEQGMVTWMVDPDGAAGEIEADAIPQPLLQFQAGAMLTASVTDDDGDADESSPPTTFPVENMVIDAGDAGLTWKWYRSSSASGPWTVVPGETQADYEVEDTADDNDEDMYLRVVATYTDRRGARNTAEFVSRNPVQISREDNTAPVFGGSATRIIVENSRKNIGAPVTANDADNDILTYSLDTGADDDVGPDHASFTIDRVTGQLKAEEGLNFEEPADAGRGNFVNGDNDYVVTIRATDSKGETGKANVTITVRDVNEAPTVTGPVTGPGMADDHPENAEVALQSGGDAWAATAEDPEGGNITWSLSGDDEELFELTDGLDIDENDERGLAFKAKPDFEKPGDANGDTYTRSRL